MKIVYEYSHLGGSEILHVRFPTIETEIRTIIENIHPDKTKISKEKTKMGKHLYSPSGMNKMFKTEMTTLGYKEVRDKFTIDYGTTEKSINAYKQVDFVKNGVYIEVQFGKYAFMFYDLFKFQYFYNNSNAEVAIEIVPSHKLHKQMSTGVSYGEQLIFDINRLKRHFPAVPVKIILVDIE
jgi:hypothetical protein